MQDTADIYGGWGILIGIIGLDVIVLRIWGLGGWSVDYSKFWQMLVSVFPSTYVRILRNSVSEVSLNGVAFIAIGWYWEEG